MAPPWATVGVFAVGVIMAVLYQRYRRYRDYESHYRRRSSPEPPQRGRNLACPICGLRVSANPYEMPCGHQFHRRCYADRLLNSRDEEGIAQMPCPICGEPGNTMSASNDHSSNGARRRNTEASAVDGSSSDRRVNCSYCSRILTSTEGERVQLDCGHFAHSTCREHFHDIQQCTNCPVNQTGSRKCSACEMPIKDKNVSKLDCGHFIHYACSSISRFTRCANCQQTEGAP